MFDRSSGWFRDLSLFVSFLILNTTLLQPAYGQQPVGLPAGAEAHSGGGQPRVAQPGGRAPFSSQTLTGVGATYRSRTTAATSQALVSAPAAIRSGLAASAPQTATAIPPVLRPVSPLTVVKPDPNYSAAGFRIRSAQPDFHFVTLGKPAPRPTASIGKAPHPMQLNGPDDPTDPYIINEAQALDNDPNQIFAFLRDKVGYEAYAGSLRGARGTLWSNAGNALDRASLLVALLNASGYSAQYVQGTLSRSQAQTLIAEMFQGPYRFIGCLPPGTRAADPVNDPALLAAVENHYWVQYNGGITLDPSFAGAQPGQVFGTSSSTFQTVPANLQNTITFEIDAETYSQASQAFAQNGFSTAAVLNQQFATATLVGKPVTIGQFVTSNAFNGLSITDTNNTYTPYLDIGENPSDPTQDDTISGTAFQETITDFPLGSTILTGLFATITVTDASGNSTQYQKTLYDRIGIAARTNGGATVTAPSNGQPALSNSDLVTFNVLPSLQDQSIVTQWGAVNDSQVSQLQSLTAQLPSNPATLTPAQSAIQQQAGTASVAAMISTQRILTANFGLISDQTALTTATYDAVRAYADSPRLIAASTFAVNNGNTSTLQFGLDLLKDDLQVLPEPGSNPLTAGPAFRTQRGILESYLESQLFTQFSEAVTSSTNSRFNIPVSTTDILQAALAQNIPLAFITPDTALQLSSLNLPADALARMSQALGAGRAVQVPTQTVTLNGTPMIGWIEYQTDGTAEGLLENGNHGLFEEYIAVLDLGTLADSGEQGTLMFFGGFITGFFTGEVINIVSLLFQAAISDCQPFDFAKGGSGCFKYSISTAQTITTFVSQLVSMAINSISFYDPFLQAGYRLGISVATDSFSLASHLDPPVPPQLMVGTTPPAPAPGSSAGVTVQVTADPLLTYPVGGFSPNLNAAQIPTVFDALITNTGPNADSFNLALLDPPAGFTLVGSLPSLIIPAGAQGEINVCAIPTGTLPASGTPASFSVSATSATNNAITSTGAGSFNVPDVQGVTLSAAPAAASTTPGTAAPVALTITGTGNINTSATLTVSGSTNVTVSGLSSPVSADPGQAVTQNLTLTPAANAALGTPLYVTISAAFGSGSTTTFTIPLTVVAAQALQAEAGIAAAAAAGRPDIAETLGNLGPVITNLVAGCTTNTVTAFYNYAQNYLTQISEGGFFQPSFLNVNFDIFADVASITCSNYTQVLTELVQVIQTVNNLLNSPAAYPFQFAITPVSVVAQPSATSTFVLQLQNQSQVTQTYNLAVNGIPPGLGGLNTTSVTLAPQQSVPAGLPADPAVTITQAGNALQSFSFTVVATPSALPNGGQSARGTVSLRPDVLDVEQVVATPGFVNAGGSVDVMAKIANTVNQPTPIQGTLTVLNSSNQVIVGAGPVSTDLGVSDLLAPLDFGQIAIPAATPNGDYTLSVTITNAQGNPLTGGTGTGYLLVGSPVTATLTVSPTTVPAGNSTVLNTLTVEPTAAPGAGSLNLVGSVTTASPAETVAVNGNTAYVCDQNEVSIVDITNPASPQLLTTALSSYIANASNIHCDIQQGNLVIFADTSSSTIGNNPGFIVFGLSNPQAPNLISAVPFDKRFVGDPIVYLNNTAFLYTNAVFTNFGNDIGSAGDIVAVNVADQANPTVLSTLSQNGDPVYGGPSEFYGEALYNSNILYGVQTTLTSSNTSGGAAALDVIDISNPSSIALSNQVTTSANGVQYPSSPLIQGNTLVAIASTGGSPNPETLIVYDISNPGNPQIVSTTLTGTFCCAGYGAAVLGPNEFLFAGTQTSSGTPVLLLVNTAVPSAPVITPITIPAAPNHLAIQGNYLYAPSASGLAIYSVPGTALNSLITGYTATVETSNSGLAVYDPASFNVTPTKITAGSGFDTLEWDNPPVSTLTWNTNVTGIQTGQIATVDQGGTVNFTSTLGNGTINLGQTTIGADQILSLSPATQTLNVGTNYFGGYPGASFTLTVRNPTESAVTYFLTFAGIENSWLPAFPYPVFPSSVTVAPQGTTTMPLNLSPPTTLPSGTYTFEVIATAVGITGFVGGTIVLANPNPQTTYPPGPGPVVTDADTDNAALASTPATLSTGRGGTVVFPVTIFNPGPSGATFQISVSGDPATGHANTTAANYNALIVPGQTLLDPISVQVPANAPLGSFNVNVSAYGGGNSGSALLTLTVNVTDAGVALSLSPQGGYLNAGGTAQLTVTNTGSAADTFNLSVSGAAAAVVSLPQTSITLNGGASQVLTVNIGNPVFAPAGIVPFTIAAQSATNPSSASNVMTSIAVNQSLSVTAAFSPAMQNIPSSGNVVFPLTVRNTGSVQNDYSVQISGTTGQLSATLTDNSGNQVQSIPDITLPSQTSGQLILTVTPSGTQGGTVAVTVTSLTSPAATAGATATLGTATTPTTLPPLPSVLTGQTVTVNRLAILNASASTDPNTPALPLSFTWTLMSKPPASALTTASIGFANAAIATFRPDATGNYVFNVSVSNGVLNATGTATYTAADLPPVAVVSEDFNVGVSQFAFPTGMNSYDPDGQPITFAWTLSSAPTGSAITTASLNNPLTPLPYFTPDVAGAYQLQLVVTDATASSLPATVTITAYSGTVPPNANAGSGVNIGTGQPVTLSGAASADPNPASPALNYQWAFASVPAGSALTTSNITGVTTVSPSFTPDVAGSYSLSLVVSNVDGTSQPSAVTVYAFSGNVPPNANAGANQYVRPNTVAALSSAGSLDPDNGPLPLASLWSLNSLPTSSTATLTNPDAPGPTFTADKSGYYTARLEATDGLASGFANTLVTSAAVCDADANGVINQLDIALIGAAIGRTALPNDPRSFDGHATIDVGDVTGCMGLISNPQPMLQVSPGTVNLTLTQGSAPSTQQISISSSGAALSFTVTSSQAWLTASIDSGSTATVSMLNAIIAPAGLQPGSYTGTLTFTPAAGTPQTVQVNLLVNPVSTPPSVTLSAMPASLQFNLAGCTSVAAPQAVSLIISGAALSYSAQTNSSWLSVSPTSGVTPALTVSVNAAGLTGSTSYYGTITVAGPAGASVIVPVTLSVGAANPLLVSPLALTLSTPFGSFASQKLSVTTPCGALPYSIAVDQPWLTLSNPNGTTPATPVVTASSGSLAQGTYSGHVTVTATGAAGSPLIVPVTFNVGTPGGPLTNGVPLIYSLVNSASFTVGPIAPGSLFSVFGANFGGGPVSAPSLPLPTQLGGVSIMINGIVAPLLYVSQTQINAQAPYGLQPGNAQIVLTANGTALAPVALQVVPTAPGVFMFLDGSGHAAAEDQNYALNSANSPASPGTYLLVYITGQGAVNPPVADGAGAPLSPYSTVMASVSATIGVQSAHIGFAGLAPMLAGVAQMNIQVPNLSPGTYPLTVTIGGQTSNVALVTIGQ